MNFSIRMVGSVVILDLEGRLTVEEDLCPLRYLLNGLIEIDISSVILNLREVLQLDCSGIGQLVLCFRTVWNRGGKLKLVNLSKRHRRLLEMTRLLTVIEAFDNEKEALASFASAPLGSPHFRSFGTQAESTTPCP